MTKIIDIKSKQSLANDNIPPKRPVNQVLVAFLEEVLERTKSGEIQGVVISCMYNDLTADYLMVGRVGGHSMVGALHTAAHILTLQNAGDAIDDWDEDA